jgi:hypothetical protein
MVGFMIHQRASCVFGNPPALTAQRQQECGISVRTVARNLCEITNGFGIPSSSGYILIQQTLSF